MIIVQYCPCGCVSYSNDPEHIRKDKERRAKGYLDALILPTEDCPGCNSEYEERNRHYDENSTN